MSECRSFFLTEFAHFSQMDEMDMILMQPSMDKATDLVSPRIGRSFSYSSPGKPRGGGNALKFHLVTEESHGGYLLSMSTARIKHLRRIVDKSEIVSLDTERVCNEILDRSSRNKISKQTFDLAMQFLIPSLKKNKKATTGDTYTLRALLSEIFAVFDPDSTGRASAIEVACGLTVLCRGKKSDKLEFAFEILDRSKKRGNLSKLDMTCYLRCFLSVLLSIAISDSLDNDEVDDTLTTRKGTECERTSKTVIQASKAGATWAAGLAFDDPMHQSSGHGQSHLSFDEFAAWYTSAGYSSIPWLELLDLQKWVLNAS